MPVNAVIIVGGPSTVTDFRPLSLYQPKPLFPVAGKPLIYHHLKALSLLPDLQEVFLVGFYEANHFTAFMDQVRRDLGVRVRYLREFEPLGTGGGLYHFRDQIGRGDPDSIVFMHTDVCCPFPLAELLQFHRQQQQRNDGRVIGSILGTRVPKEVAHNFGCMIVDAESKRCRHYVEKPETNVSDLISCGIYVFSPAIFEEIRQVLNSRDSDEHVDSVMLEKEVLGPLSRRASGLFVHETREFWRQIKSASAMVAANRLYLDHYSRQDPAYLANNNNNGPTIIAPVYIHPTAKVDSTAVLGPNVSIDANCVIEAGVRIKEAVILPGVRVKENACVIDAIVGWNSTLGTWSRVEGSPVGSNFEDELITCNGVKKPSVTILSGDINVADEKCIRNCIVLPHKDLTSNYHNEIVM